MKKKIMSIVLSASMLASLGMSQGVMAEEDDGVIKIGVVAPMTGGLAVLGEGLTAFGGYGSGGNQ